MTSLSLSLSPLAQKGVSSTGQQDSLALQATPSPPPLPLTQTKPRAKTHKNTVLYLKFGLKLVILYERRSINYRNSQPLRQRAGLALHLFQ